MAEPFRVGFVPGVSPGKWLRTWRERQPDLPLEAEQVAVADQRDLLTAGALDMCFVRLPIDHDGLHLIPLYAEVPVVVAAKDHPVAAFDELDVADLSGEHLLQDAAEVPEWAAVADEVRDATRVSPPDMTVAQAIEVVASGAGIAIVPMSLARLHQRKDVRYRPVTGVAQSEVGLAWLADNGDPRVETFIGIVRGRTERSSRQPTEDGAAPSAEGSPRRDGQVKQPGSRKGRAAARARRPGSSRPGAKRGRRRR